MSDVPATDTVPGVPDAPETLELIREGGSSKGNPLEVARIAAIMAAKKTSDLIPLSHSVPLSQLAVAVEFVDAGIEITATAKTFWTTGVEMEALTAVSVAALTVYDMLKSLDKSMIIDNVRLLSKSGGKSGDFKRPN